MSGDRPDWVMLGVPQPNGKGAIFASTDLTEAELRHETEMDKWARWSLVPPTRHLVTRIFLEVQMRTYVMVVADTYAEALATLLREWKPERQSQHALDLSGPREIEAAT